MLMKIKCMLSIHMQVFQVEKNEEIRLKKPAMEIPNLASWVILDSLS